MDKELATGVLQYLQEVYDRKPTEFISTPDLSKYLKTTETKIQGALMYLREKEHIKSYIKSDIWYQRINAKGIDELEKQQQDTDSDESSHGLELDVENDDFQGIMKVFISHKFVKSDQQLSLKLQEALRKKKINGYLAERKRNYDILINEKIKKEIDGSDYVVGIITKKSKNSASVNQELGYAMGKRIPIILMVEKGMKHGVLTYGKDVEEFTSEDFGKYCKNVVNYLLGNTPKDKSGLGKKVLETVAEGLLGNFQP